MQMTLLEALFSVELQGESFRIVQQQSVGSFEDFLPGALSLPPQFPAIFGQFDVEQFDEHHGKIPMSLADGDLIDGDQNSRCFKSGRANRVERYVLRISLTMSQPIPRCQETSIMVIYLDISIA